MAEDLLKLVAKKATWISREERLEMNRQTFERMGYDMDDLTRMADAVDMDVEDILCWDVRGGGVPLPRPSDPKHAASKAWVELTKEFKRLATLVETSLGISEECLQTHLAPAIHEGELRPGGGVQTAAFQWCHAASETRPSEYQHGPLTGNQKQLAQWITGKNDRRRLHAYCQTGAIWVRRLNYRKYEAWFRNERRFEAANRFSLLDSS